MMRRRVGLGLTVGFLWMATVGLFAGPVLNQDAFGLRLGGWKHKGRKACEYQRSGSKYRTWRPEVTPMVDGSIFISVRIDHLRGMFASDDHAVLEVTFAPDGNVASARSTVALQGKRITSDLIRRSAELGKSTVLEGIAQVGGDLLADLSEKLLREKVVEPGRVTFPSIIQHNYNLLCQSVHAIQDGQRRPAPRPKQPALQQQ